MRKYICSKCENEYNVEKNIFRCDCGAPLDLKKTVSFPLKSISIRPKNMWRYREALPIENEESIVSLGEGMTPLVDVDYSGLNLKAKVEYINPTGSFKDRGASVLTSFMKEIGVDHFVEDSSGNAGSAMSAYAARGGLKCEIFCPDYASLGKLTQVRMYGAKLNRITGTRADTAKAIIEKAESVYYGSHNWNPFFIEGLKTIAYEIAEQMNWQAPDNVVCPLGYGGLFLGLHLGFKELLDWNIVEKMPRLFGVQPEVCAPLYAAFKANRKHVEAVVQTSPTMAEGVCAGDPPRGNLILQAMYECNGAVTIVGEEEIKEGVRWLAEQGLYVEPTSAVVIKAIDHFLNQKQINPQDRTVVVLTGSGLKATEEIQEKILKVTF